MGQLASRVPRTGSSSGRSHSKGGDVTRLSDGEVDPNGSNGSGVNEQVGVESTDPVDVVLDA